MHVPASTKNPNARQCLNLHWVGLHPPLSRTYLPRLKQRGTNWEAVEELNRWPRRALVHCAGGIEIDGIGSGTPGAIFSSPKTGLLNGFFMSMDNGYGVYHFRQETVSCRVTGKHLGREPRNRVRTSVKVHWARSPGERSALWGLNASQLAEKAEAQPADAVFTNARGQPLSRDGVHYILTRHVKNARTKCPSLKTKRVSPYVLRHSTAMDLLQSGVDRSVIAMWLGHESMDTTQMYLHAEKALAKTEPFRGRPGRYRPRDQLLAFLQAL